MKNITIFEEKEMDRIQLLLEEIDVEIGSTLNFKEDPDKVKDNMIRANRYLQELKDILGIKF